MSKDLRLTPEEIKKAKIKDGALIGCDFHYCSWKDEGEIFTVEDIGCVGRRRLIADGYGSKEHYGNGALYAREEDLIYVDEAQLTKALGEKNKEPIVCPFCGDDAYDLVGLKDHLTYCGAYQSTEIMPPSLFREVGDG